MRFLSRLFLTPSRKALAHAHEQAEIARLQSLNRDPPPGNGWRLAPQDSEGKWTVWNGPRPVASFWDENEAAEWARQMNRDRQPNPVQREDGCYCVNCGSRETDDSLKARGYVSCCPERYVIPEAWHVTGDRLATGNWHVWRPADGLPSIDADHSWPERADAQYEADYRNLLAVSPVPMGGQNSGFRPDGRLNLYYRDVEHVRTTAKTPAERDYDRLAPFLNVRIPEGVRMVVGPIKSPDDGNWWTFDRSGPVRGYTRKSNAQAAADRANNAPPT